MNDWKKNNNGKNMCWKSKFFAYTVVILRKIKKVPDIFMDNVILL